ncbi:7-carboxy-7-deazaguanine synthase QueE [[Eubacterium] cellulosolvens]
MKINEIFYSIQGEGKYMGLPMAFIRVTGCNLRCIWCDTKYAYEEGEELTVDQIITRITGYPTKRVCITGGEPLAQNGIMELINRLITNGFKIYLETNGSIFLGELPRSDAIRISIDIKCPSSGESQKMNFANLELLSDDDQVKFIIANQEDFEYAKNLLDKHSISNRCSIIFTPCDPNHLSKAQEVITLQKLAEWVLRDGLVVFVLPQLHKLLWPDKNRGI